MSSVLTVLCRVTPLVTTGLYRAIKLFRAEVVTYGKYQLISRGRNFEVGNFVLCRCHSPGGRLSAFHKLHGLEKPLVTTNSIAEECLNERSANPVIFIEIMLIKSVSTKRKTFMTVEFSDSSDGDVVNCLASRRNVASRACVCVCLCHAPTALHHAMQVALCLVFLMSNRP